MSAFENKVSKENQFFINKSKLHLSRKEVSSFLLLAADAASYIQNTTTTNLLRFFNLRR